MKTLKNSLLAITFLLVAQFTFSLAAQSTAQPDEQALPEKLFGTVLLPNGDPVPDAPVVFSHSGLIRQTRTDDDGRFELPVDRDQILEKVGRNGFRWLAVASFAKGYGVGWVNFNDIIADKPTTIRLVEDVPIQGRILDQQGRPVEGVTLEFSRVQGAHGNLDGFLKASRDQPGRMSHYQQRSMTYFSPNALRLLRGGETMETPVATTDARGSFEMSGFGRERAAYVIMKHPQLKNEMFFIATRKKLEARWKRGPLSRETKMHLESGGLLPIVHAAEFRHLASPGLTIRGRLTAQDNGEPIAGMNVAARVRGGSSTHGTSDAKGHYVLTGLSTEGELRVSALNPGGLPWLDGSRSLRITADSKPDEINLKLDRGVAVSGRVVDDAGKPVVGWVGYLAWPDNPELKKLASRFDSSNTSMTIDDGKYTVVVPQGSGVLYFNARERTHYAYAMSDDFGFPMDSKRKAFYSTNRGIVRAEHFNVLKRIDPTAEQHQLGVDMIVSSGAPIKGRVIAGDGTAVKQFFVAGLSENGRSVRNDGRFEVRGLKTGDTRLVYFRTTDQKWAAIREFKLPKNGKPEAQVVRLEACGTISGRLADADGKPRSGWMVMPFSEGAAEAISTRKRRNGMFEFGEKPARTDANGYFRLKGVPANTTIEILAGARSDDGTLGKPSIVKSVRIRPKQNLDIDVVKVSDTPATATQ